MKSNVPGRMTKDEWLEDWAQKCLEHALTVQHAGDSYEIFKAGLNDAWKMGYAARDAQVKELVEAGEGCAVTLARYHEIVEKHSVGQGSARKCEGCGTIDHWNQTRALPTPIRSNEVK